MSNDSTKPTVADRLVETLEALRTAENNLWRLRIDAAQAGNENDAIILDKAHNAVGSVMRKHGKALSCLLTEAIHKGTEREVSGGAEEEGLSETPASGRVGRKGARSA